MDFEIEQRLIGSQSLREICERLAPQSRFDELGDMTGYLAAHGAVHSASKILHHRPDGSSRYVLEVFEKGGRNGDRYVVLTVSRDFAADEALSIYRHFYAIHNPY